MLATRMQKKIKILELFNKIKESECQKEMRNLSSERSIQIEAVAEKNMIAIEIDEVDLQLVSQTHNDISTFNFEQMFNYAAWLQQQSETLDITLSIAESNIANIERQLKNILKQEETINNKIDDTKKELNKHIDHQYVLNNR